MAHGKYISLEEVHKLKRLDQFCKKHPSKGNKKDFEKLFESMALGKPSKDIKKDDG